MSNKIDAKSEASVSRLEGVRSLRRLNGLGAGAAVAFVILCAMNPRFGAIERIPHAIAGLLPINPVARMDRLTSVRIEIIRISHAVSEYRNRSGVWDLVTYGFLFVFLELSFLNLRKLSKTSTVSMRRQLMVIGWTILAATIRFGVIEIRSSPTPAIEAIGPLIRTILNEFNTVKPLEVWSKIAWKLDALEWKLDKLERAARSFDRDLMITGLALAALFLANLYLLSGSRQRKAA